MSTENTKQNDEIANPSSRFYTLKEAAGILCRSEKTISRLIQRGKLRRDETFYRIRIPRKDVDSFAEKNSDYAFAA